MRLAIALLFVFFLSSCGGIGPPVQDNNSQIDMSGYTRIGQTAVWRVEDKEAGVICYTYYSQSIDCLPISETILKR